MWHWRSNKEKERLAENRQQMKRQVEVMRELKTGRQLLLIKFKKLFTFKDATTLVISFLVFALDNYNCFHSWVSRGLL